MPPATPRARDLGNRTRASSDVAPVATRNMSFTPEGQVAHVYNYWRSGELVIHNKFMAIMFLLSFPLVVYICRDVTVGFSWEGWWDEILRNVDPSPGSLPPALRPWVDVAKTYDPHCSPNCWHYNCFVLALYFSYYVNKYKICFQ